MHTRKSTSRRPHTTLLVLFSKFIRFSQVHSAQTYLQRIQIHSSENYDPSVICGAAERNVSVFFFFSLLLYHGGKPARNYAVRNRFYTYGLSRSEWDYAAAGICDRAHARTGTNIIRAVHFESHQLTNPVLVLGHCASSLGPDSSAFFLSSHRVLFARRKTNVKLISEQRLRGLHVKHFIKATDLGYV